MSEPSLPALLDDRSAYKARLQLVMPESLTGTRATCSGIAAAAAFTLVYVGAIDQQRPVRPAMIVGMSDAAARHRQPTERLAWYRAAKLGNKAVADLLDGWGEVDKTTWYATNSREGVRDETFPAWSRRGALIVDESVPTTSSRGRYSLAPDFAALLDPNLTGDDLEQRVRSWQDHHLTMAARLRAQRDRDVARADHALAVSLPGGVSRNLLPGQSSVILKGVIEEWTKMLDDPVVVFISQSGEKVNVFDNQLLTSLGLSIDQQRFLPDCLIADLAGEESLWLVEVVASDGPITEERREAMTRWATGHGLAGDRCQFLTAFTSRTSAEAKRALPVLARGSHAWFLDEPDALLSWLDLPTGEFDEV